MVSGILAPLRLEGSEEGLLPAELDVVSFSCTEALSLPYRLEVEFSTSDSSFDVDTLLEKSLSVVSALPGREAEVFSGQVATARFVRAVGRKLHFSLLLRPALYWLALREDARIYPDATIPEILRTVLGPQLASDATFHLSRTYPKRPFTVQYGESPLNFLHRLCEDVGIVYCFRHGPEGSKLVFFEEIEDIPGTPEPLELSLGPTALGTLPLAFLRARHRLRTSSVAMRDFDLAAPDVPPEVVLPVGEVREPQPVYVYPGGFVEAEDAKMRASALLRSLRHDAELFEGRLDHPGAHLGRAAKITGAAEAELDGEVRFVEVQRRGTQHTVDEGAVASVVTHFRAVPKGVSYLPPRRAFRPRIHGVQTAVVVGDDVADQSIYVDNYGRVKVHFHWDRLQPANEKASAWVRVMQPNLGGSMILPRVGWEVAIEFLDGDPEQPVVLGKVYNAENMPPLSLPNDKASGSFSSKSSPGGAGGNKITMGDSGGKQGFSVQAQKDFNFSTGYDQIESVVVDDESQINANRSRTVKVDDSSTISGNQSVTIGAHRSCKIGGNLGVSVSGNEVANAKANALEKVTGGRRFSVDGNQLMVSNGVRMNVTADLERKVGAAEILCTASSFSENVGTAASSSVGAARVHLTGGEHGEVVTGAKSVTYAGAAAYVVQGSQNASCDGAVARLIGGLCQRKVTGTYTIKAPMITIVGGTGKFKGGSSELSMTGGPIKMKGGKITIKAAIIKKTAGSIKLG